MGGIAIVCMISGGNIVKRKENKMENKEVKKLNRAFKVLKWLFIASAGLSVVSMVMALVTKDITLFNYVMKCIDNILGSLLIAFICSRTVVTPKNEEE